MSYVFGGAAALSASATLNFPSTAAATSSDLTMSVPGAVAGDTIALGNPAPPANSAYSAWISAAGEATVRLMNNSTLAAVDPPAATFTIRILR
jgi:hypothetical protein